MRIIGAIFGVLLYANLLLNVTVLTGAFFFATSIQGWQYGMLFSFALLMLILSSISVFGVKIIYVFPGDRGWAIISILLLVFLGANWMLGNEYVNSLKSGKEAYLRDQSIRNNLSESQLESIQLIEGTPLYEMNAGKVTFNEKLSPSLIVRVYPKTIDIGGVIYREVVFPRKNKKGEYLKNIWDSGSEKYLVEVASLAEVYKKKAEDEDKADAENKTKADAKKKLEEEKIVYILHIQSGGAASYSLPHGEYTITPKTAQLHKMGENKYRDSNGQLSLESETLVFFSFANNIDSGNIKITRK